MCLNFQDTMGQEKYQNFVANQYIHDSHIILLVFDSITLNELINCWYKYYKDNTNIDNAKFIIIGNKSDIFGDNRDEIIKQGNKFSEEIDALFITCSAKSADNMDNLESYIIAEARRYIDEEDKRNDNKENKL